jgi:uncharacterized membrane-anchored protein YjiN (DUF445 family)
MKPGRFEFVKYNQESIKKQEYFKDLVTRLEKAIVKLPTIRETSMALTRLEECYMWIGKSIRNEQNMRETSEKVISGIISNLEKSFETGAAKIVKAPEKLYAYRSVRRENDVVYRDRLGCGNAHYKRAPELDKVIL